jgi:hypothetical protein
MTAESSLPATPDSPMSLVGALSHTHLEGGPQIGTSLGQETAVIAAESSASQTVAMANTSRQDTALVTNSHPNLISTNKSAASESIWLVPHVAEHLKHTWYRSSLGMGSKRIQDQWGFSSANPSRSQSPRSRGRADAEA